MVTPRPTSKRRTSYLVFAIGAAMSCLGMLIAALAQQNETSWRFVAGTTTTLVGMGACALTVLIGLAFSVRDAFRRRRLWGWLETAEVSHAMRVAKAAEGAADRTHSDKSHRADVGRQTEWTGMVACERTWIAQGVAQPSLDEQAQSNNV